MSIREKIAKICAGIGRNVDPFEAADEILDIPELKEALRVVSNLKGETDMIAVGCDGKAVRYDHEREMWIEIPPLSHSISTGTKRD